MGVYEEMEKIVKRKVRGSDFGRSTSHFVSITPRSHYNRVLILGHYKRDSAT